MYVCLVGCVISGSYFSSHRQARQYLRSNTNYNICLMLCLFRFFCFPRFFFFFYIAPQSRSISFPHLVSDSPITLTETNGRKSRPFQKKKGGTEKRIVRKPGRARQSEKAKKILGSFKTAHFLFGLKTTMNQWIERPRVLIWWRQPEEECRRPLNQD